MTDQKVISSIPDGYIVGHSATFPAGATLELVPEGETVKEWTEMITFQVMRNENCFTLPGFRAAMEMLWYEIFPGSTSKLVEQGSERGQPMVIWSQSCRHNAQTGMPEMTWFKAAIRDDTIILVQKAFKFQPTDEQIAFWIDFLRSAQVILSANMAGARVH